MSMRQAKLFLPTCEVQPIVFVKGGKSMRKTSFCGLHCAVAVIHPQLLPGVHAHNTMVVEPLLVADAVCIQIIVLDGGHGVSCKAFILPF